MEYALALLALILGVLIGWVSRNRNISALKAELTEQKSLREAEIKINQSAREHAAQTLEDERRRFAEIKNESDRQWELKFDSIKKELQKMVADQINASGDALRRSNRESIDMIFRPVKEQFEGLKKSVDDSRTQNEVSKKEMQEKFDATLRLFIQQQDSAVKQLRDETSRIGNDAVNLANALKTNTKKQGNWGEMVLETMLENSGLQENIHFFKQPNYKDKNGNDFRPDVVVRFPEGRNLIVDSKVSLTAYAESFETDDENRREELLRSHLDSVWRHIDELSRKDYPRIVDNSIDYVLMFIPNESSYIAAVKMDGDLLHKAMEKKVIVISPNNLMMALHLAFMLWQNDAQIKNVENIVKRARQLYEKVYNFQASFTDIGKKIDALQSTFKTASSQAFTGPGNVLRQCEMLREMGVSVDPKKQLPVSREEMEEEKLIEAKTDKENTP